MSVAEMISPLGFQYEPDHETRMLKRIPWFFRSKPKFRAMMKARAAAIQAYEDMVFDVMQSYFLPNAVGEQLNVLGRIVGERRDGLSNTDYRRFIGARILANKCTSTVDEYIRILDILCDECDIKHFWLPDSGGTFYIVRKKFMKEKLRNRVALFMREIKPAGRVFEVIETTNDPYAFSRVLLD